MNENVFGGESAPPKPLVGVEIVMMASEHGAARRSGDFPRARLEIKPHAAAAPRRAAPRRAAPRRARRRPLDIRRASHDVVAGAGACGSARDQ
jgi:hypothetical protein